MTRRLSAANRRACKESASRPACWVLRVVGGCRGKKASELCKLVAGLLEEDTRGVGGGRTPKKPWTVEAKSTKVVAVNREEEEEEEEEEDDNGKNFMVAVVCMSVWGEKKREKSESPGTPCVCVCVVVPPTPTRHAQALGTRPPLTQLRSCAGRTTKRERVCVCARARRCQVVARSECVNQRRPKAQTSGKTTAAVALWVVWGWGGVGEDEGGRGWGYAPRTWARRA